ncbi:hypothetical protein Pint_08465 [Pistacia integerrima]|uniref:Uncharacterized protein n=1 Tax=Pistacia integerrima TaxID=434235 RepID=A0ACC0XX71_9ROSI|nr:hypothetical protein Pint_08465 [Pistacia integerrima]
MSGKQVVGGPSHDSGGGGKKVAAMQLEREVMLGDIIWVKLQSNSWWPAQVVDENTVSESNKPDDKAVGAALVRLYGTYEYLYVDLIKSRLEFQIVLEQNNGSHREIFEKALEQVIIFILHIIKKIVSILHICYTFVANNLDAEMYRSFSHLELAQECSRMISGRSKGKQSKSTGYQFFT